MRPIILIFITIILFSCNTNKKKALSHLTSAISYYRNDNYVDATKEIEAATKLDTGNLEIKYWECKIMTETKKYDQSTNNLFFLLKRKYKLDTVYYLISRNYFEQAQSLTYQKNEDELGKSTFIRSAKYADSALLINSLYYAAYQGKIRAYHNAEKYQEALITTNVAISLFPDSVQFFLLRGTLKYQLGDITDALNDLNLSITNKVTDSTDMATALRFRAIIYYSRDSVDKAIKDLTLGISFNSKDEFLYEQRANYFKAKGLKLLACNDYRKAADLGMLTVYDEIKNYCNN
jgi:tetratricopeptide (TPR) repeat protein